jgi:teichuronic acid biosynthesis glycosyltransferase TuaG
MLEKHLVSIITPVYNSGRTIKDTIESVISQTFKNWEMLIINDCSSDNSVEIIEKYCAKDPRIKLFSTPTPSGSPSLPRNIGLENAKGDYIAFLDSDDVWLPHKLEEQLEFMTSNDYNLVYSHYEKIDSNGNRNNRRICTRSTSTYDTLLMSNAIPCLTSMVKRSAIGCTRFRQIHQEDFCFWLDILKKGLTAYNYPKVTALYRESEKSRSSNKIQMFIGYWDVIRKYQGRSILASCFYMVTYTIFGFAKYLK